MEQNNQLKISMIKYVLTNPKFSFFDKVQFFGYFFISLIFIFIIILGTYKVIKENYDISYPVILIIVLVLMSPFIKFTQYFAKKFTIPYKNFIGESEKAKEIEESFDKGMGIIRDEQKIGYKYYFLLIIPILIFVVFVFILFNKFILGLMQFSGETKSFQSLFGRQILTVGIICGVVFFVILIFWNKKESELIKKYFPGKETFVKKLDKWIYIITIIILFLFIFWLFLK